MPLTSCTAPTRSAAILTLAVLGIAPAACADTPAIAAKGAAVTVLTATKSCFGDVVEASGILIPREETAVRPDRPGLRVSEVLIDPGQTVTAGQTLARLTAPDGGAVQVQAPVAGLVKSSSAIIGAIASGRGEALFSIIPRGEFELVAQVATRDLDSLKVDQPAKIRVVGAGDVEGKVRRIAPVVEPNTQLGQVFIPINSSMRLMANAHARAVITTGESCGIALPLTAILYSTAGTVVQVVKRDRVETRRVETGLMSIDRVEIRTGLVEGDVVVVRAGALLREGDPVRSIPQTADVATGKQ